jgi:hypothetical protein
MRVLVLFCSIICVLGSWFFAVFGCAKGRCAGMRGGDLGNYEDLCGHALKVLTKSLVQVCCFCFLALLYDVLTQV